MEETTAMQWALKLLNRQAYSEEKLRQKLEQSGISDTETKETLNRLISWGYLNDREFVINRIRMLQTRLKSREYIRCDLSENGIAGCLIDELLSEYYPRETELEIARQYLKKRNRTSKKAHAGVRTDWNALARAGFCEDTICRCFPEIII